jgi:hypothetical protein
MLPTFFEWVPLLEKGQVKIHTALFTEKIEAHEPHSKQGINAAVDAKGIETMLCGF